MHDAGDLSFIETLRCEEDYVSVKIKKMTDNHAAFWHENIQKIIFEEYTSATSGDTKKTRADVTWNWLNLKNYLELLSKLKVGNFTSELYCIILKTEDLEDVPIGMLATVPQYTCKIHDKKEPRNFVWFFSDAPLEFYERIGMKKISDVPLAAIDTAIVSAHHKGKSTEIFLRCANEGGERLKRFYREKCGMEQLGPSSIDPGIIRKALGHPLDSFYYLTKQAAIAFSENLRLKNKFPQENEKIHPENRTIISNFDIQPGERS